MSGRVHKIAATIAATAVFAAGSAHAQQADAGTMLKGRGGWSASLFVPAVEKRNYTEDPSMRAPSPPVVNFAASRPIAKDARVGIDVFNVFDRKARILDNLGLPGGSSPATPSDDYLFHPAEPRGFRLRLRVTF